MLVSNRDLGAERNDALRRAVRTLIERDFAGNQSAAAKAFGVSAAAISDLLSGKRGGGMKLIDGIRAYTGGSFDAVVAGDDDHAQVARYRTANVLGNHQEWPALRAELERLYGRVYGPEVFELAASTGQFGTGLPSHLTIEFGHRALEFASIALQLKASQAAEAEPPPAKKSPKKKEQP